MICKRCVLAVWYVIVFVLCGRCVLAVWCITVLVWYVGDVYWQYGALQFFCNMWEICTGSMAHYSSYIICGRYVLAV